MFGLRWLGCDLVIAAHQCQVELEKTAVCECCVCLVCCLCCDFGASWSRSCVWHAEALFTAFLRLMFWYSLPAPPDGRHDYNNLPMRKDEWIGRKTLFDEKTGTFWANEELSVWSQCTRSNFLKHFWGCLRGRST